VKRLAILLACLPGATFASDLPNLRSLAQSEFRKVSQDLGAAAAYKGVTPATPLGPLGFDVGLEVTHTTFENSGLFSKAGSSTSEVVIPKLHVTKGLFAGLDVGAFVGGVPEYDAALFGAELRYAILDDGLARPALGVRLSGTATHGLGPIDITTAALDVLVSKKFTLLTPYAGAGVVRVQSKAGGVGLADEKFNESRIFGGLNLNLVAANFAFEVEKMGDNTSISAKVGWRF